jgi:dsDNA-specific endonuclease/ATPase MutS2
MTRTRIFAFALLFAALGVPSLARLHAQESKKEYLTSLEADKIRDAEQPALRIKLFIEFAADRLKKFHYELARPSSERMRAERLNSLLNAYTGCVDDAAELIDLGRERQDDIRAGIRELQKRAKEFLPQLEKLATEGTDLALYKDTLQDAIEATRQAQADAEKAAKELAPAPVRRKPS